MTRLIATWIAALAVALLGACSSSKIEDAPVVEAQPDYARPLAPGESALRLVTDPDRLPDLAAVYRSRGPVLLDAIDESLLWFEAPSSRQWFPIDGVTHEQAKASVAAFKDLIEHAPSESVFVGELQRLFDVYESVGYDGNGTVLFTGYFAPIMEASAMPTSRFAWPLYRRPADLVTDPVTGDPQGRRAPDGGLAPYQTRREIEQSGMLRGSELVWLEDPLSVYIVHVNGSAKLRLQDGQVMYVGYAGKTDRPYTGLGQSMIEAGFLTRAGLSLSAIKRAYKEHPQRVEELILRNENYVFFTEYDGGSWPAGSLGVKVTPESSLATDKRIYPRGGVVVVDTQSATFSRGQEPFLRLMLDQDTGGAIKAPGRADIFMGIGPSAEILAGGQYAEGRLFYLFLKPEHVGGELAEAPTR
jgi:membrane-bound lytic murein transglycosylase A